ncbi:uncharacterized protein M6B38_386215 [Iris pallida]|uniref:Uncharacterized protein n=1 Tax=Iris pallida TaxID=29817 RepID=A0AAX6G4B4_IRIPA|nr:uncharacterized protein M6B38_386215 [Iris pallida]
MVRSSNRGKSTAVRKPLVEISNGGGRPSTQISIKKKKQQQQQPPPPPGNGNGNGDSSDGAADHLLLLRASLSTLVSQVDDLVSKASKHKMFSRTASQDIESFENVLSDMVSSLKPWISRLEKAFGSKEHQADQPSGINSISCYSEDANVARSNKNAPDMDLIVSPSPLVSWHAGLGGGACKMESGRQLFLLTPLPKPKFLPSKCPVTSTSMVRILHDEDEHLGVPPTLLKKAHHGMSERLEADLVQRKVFTSCTEGAKGSTSEGPLSSPLRYANSKNRRVSLVLSTPCLNKSPTKALLDLIPDQVKYERDCSDDLVSEVPHSVASRYQELLGLKHTRNCTTRRKEENETLDWFLSPPKTCILMEPTDEKPVPTPANSFSVMLATPLRTNLESTMQRGKQPGENTLKKELWTRFEEVSTDGLRFDASVFQQNAHKGFLDMLEEASCETADPDCSVARKK